MIYRFEQFEVDDREFRFSEHGTPLQVEPKVLRYSSISLRTGAAWFESRSCSTPYGRTPWSPRTPSPAPSDCSAKRSTKTAAYRNSSKQCPPRATVSSPASPRGGTSTPESATPLDRPPPRKTQSRIQALNQMGSCLRSPTRHRRRRYLPSFSHHKKVLTEKDTVVLADFDNSTGDPVFDGTLRQGMAVQLEQSPFLSLISDQRIQQTLKLMGQPQSATHSSDRPRDLRANRKRGRSRRLHRATRHSVCPRAASNRLPQRKGPRRGAGAGGQKRGCAECPGSDCQVNSEPKWANRSPRSKSTTLRWPKLRHHHSKH